MLQPQSIFLRQLAQEFIVGSFLHSYLVPNCDTLGAQVDDVVANVPLDGLDVPLDDLMGDVINRNHDAIEDGVTYHTADVVKDGVVDTLDVLMDVVTVDEAINAALATINDPKDAALNDS